MSQGSFGGISSYSGLNSGQFPSPWWDYASTEFPETMQLALRYCEYIFIKNGIYRSAVDRLLSYFITDLDISGPKLGEDEEEQWKAFFYNDLSYQSVLHTAGLDGECYGNYFCSVLPTFKRFLSCPKCFYEAPLRRIYNDPTFAFKWSDFTPNAFCPRCKTTGKWSMIDRRTSENGGFYIKRWNPHEMELLWDPLTDQCSYIWKVPEDYRRMIREGHLYHLERATKEVIQAVKHNNYILFDKDMVYHMRVDALAGVRNRGWGISKVLSNFSQAFYVQVLHRYNEAIALDYVIPFRVITPAPGDKGSGIDPILSQNLGSMGAQVNAMLRRRRRDPASWHFLPFPVNYTALGGDANKLAPSDLLKLGREDLLDNIGVPVELFKGTMQLQAAPVALRLMEAVHASIPRNLNGLLKFITKKVSAIKGWVKADVRLARVTHADDLNRQQAKLQLMMGGQISATTGLKSIGLEYRDEVKRQMDDQHFQAEEQSKLKEEMGQAATMEQLIQSPPGGGAPGQPGQPGQQQGGAPQQGGQGQPQGQGGPAAGAYQSVTANLPTGPNEKVSPEEMQEKAQYISQQLMGMDAGQRQSELRKLKQVDPTMHSIVTAFMRDLRQQAQRQGGAQVLAQQFGKSGVWKNGLLGVPHPVKPEV
jgi:hypothetical protein